MPALEDRAFLLLLVAVSIAFAWVIWPFFGAILWGVVLAIVFAPLYRGLLARMGQRRSLAAVTTVMVIVALVIVPLILIAIALVQEATRLFAQIQSGELDLVRMFYGMFEWLPVWATRLLDHFGLASLSGVQEQLSNGIREGSQFLAAQALSVGQGTFNFVVNLFLMLYLLFFLFRDGDALCDRIRAAIPLRAGQRETLLVKFTTVVRATVKGDMLVALVQGTLGGLIFWVLGFHAVLLWAVVMAFCSLLPAVGAGLIWLPAALYLLATGSIWQSVVLVLYGVLVIGLIDNLLRPVLIGKDTKMPDYVVLISTVGGLAVFGLNGFILGPVIAAMFIAVWDSFTASRRERP